MGPGIRLLGPPTWKVHLEMAVKKTAGSADIRKGARITGPARDKLAVDLARKYQKGESIRALAESTGRSYGFVHRLLVDGDVALRARGGATRVGKK